MSIRQVSERSSTPCPYGDEDDELGVISLCREDAASKVSSVSSSVFESMRVDTPHRAAPEKAPAARFDEMPDADRSWEIEILEAFTQVPPDSVESLDELLLIFSEQVEPEKRESLQILFEALKETSLEEIRGRKLPSETVRDSIGEAARKLKKAIERIPVKPMRPLPTGKPSTDLSKARHFEREMVQYLNKESEWVWKIAVEDTENEFEPGLRHIYETDPEDLQAEMDCEDAMNEMLDQIEEPY